MTLIIGIENTPHAWMVADSGVWGGGGERYVLRGSKLWRSGKWICGGAGSAVACDMAKDLPMPKTADEKALRTWALKLRAKVSAEAAHGLGGPPEKSADYGYDMLVGFGAKIWNVNCDGAVSRDQSGIYTIGADSLAARAALLAVMEYAKTNVPLKQAMAAIAVARQVTTFVSEPFHAVTTATKHTYTHPTEVQP